MTTALKFYFSAMHEPSRLRFCAGAMIASQILIFAPAAFAQADASLARTGDSSVEVVSVAEVAQTEHATQRECWQTLMTEREYQLNAANARPWLLRYSSAISGAALGAATGAYFAAREVSAIWIAPAVIGGGVLGALAGPLGVVLGLGIGAVVDWRTSALIPSIAAGVGAAAIGKVMWNALVPPPSPVRPESPTDVPLDRFVRASTCATDERATVRQPSKYRVTYVFDGETFSVDLPADPGATVTVDAAGMPRTDNAPQ